MLLLWSTAASDWLQHGFSCTLLGFQHLRMKEGQKTVDAEVMLVCTESVLLCICVISTFCRNPQQWYQDRWVNAALLCCLSLVVNISKSCITSALPMDAHLPVLSAFQQWWCCGNLCTILWCLLGFCYINPHSADQLHSGVCLAERTKGNEWKEKAP